MAGSSTLSDVVFLTDPPESLVCLICLSVADKPQQINCCGTVFCDSCLTQYMDLRDECPHCRQEGDPFDDKRSTREIQALRVKCGHHENGCGWVGPLSTLSQHTTRCNYKLVSCKYAAVGCEAKVIRKDIKQHDKNHQLHLQLSMEKIVVLSKKMAALESKVTNEQKTNCFTIKMSNFEHHINNDGFVSTSFTTTPPGHTLKVCVEKSTDDRNIIECASILQNQTDFGPLIYPFPGNVTVEILNQLEDKNHHLGATHQTPTSKGIENGFCIRRSKLMFNQHLNTQYLKDDSLVVRLTVQHSGLKQWLQETTV